MDIIDELQFPDNHLENRTARSSVMNDNHGLKLFVKFMFLEGRVPDSIWNSIKNSALEKKYCFFRCQFKHILKFPKYCSIQRTSKEGKKVHLSPKMSFKNTGW